MRDKGLTWETAEKSALYLMALSMPVSIAAANIALGLGVLLTFRRIVISGLNFEKLGGALSLLLLLHLTIDFSAMFFSGYPVKLLPWFEDKWVLMNAFVALVLVRNLKTGEYALYLMMIAGMAVAVLAIFQYTSGWDPVRNLFLEFHGGGYMALGTFNHHLTYGGVALIIALVALSRFPFSGSWLDYSRATLCVILGVVGLYTSFARSALVGYAFGALAVVWSAPKRLRKWAFGAIVSSGALMLIILPGMATRFLYLFQGSGADEGPRIRLWKSALNIIANNPLFGVGQGNWREAFYQHGVSGKYLSIAHPHCDLLSVAVDGGIPALVTFLIFWIAVVVGMIRFLKREQTGSAYNIVKIGLAVTIGILFAGLFQNYQTDAEVANLLWFTVGTSLATIYLVNREKTDA